jgi:hypothetical protein
VFGSVCLIGVVIEYTTTLHSPKENRYVYNNVLHANSEVSLLRMPSSGMLRRVRPNFSEDGILHSHRRENLKSYIALIGSDL